MAEKKKDAIAKVEKYAIVEKAAEIADIVRQNLGGGSISQFDLDRVTVPPGGGSHFMVPSLQGEDPAKEICGVVIYWKETRAWWKNEDDERPACSSQDCLNGYNPEEKAAKLCNQCPMSQFESSDKGRGQACKLSRHLFLVRETDFLPFVLSLPPTSIANCRKFFMRLASKGGLYSSVVTKFTLEPRESAGKQKYSVVIATHMNPGALGYTLSMGQSGSVPVDPASAEYLHLLVPGEEHRPGMPSYYPLSGGKINNPSTLVAGTTYQVTVLACDLFWNINKDANPLVKVETTDPYDNDPNSVGLDNGKKTYPVRLRRASISLPCRVASASACR